MDDDFGDDYGFDEFEDETKPQASNGQALLDEIDELGLGVGSPQVKKTPQPASLAKNKISDAELDFAEFDAYPGRAAGDNSIEHAIKDLNLSQASVFGEDKPQPRETIATVTYV